MSETSGFFISQGGDRRYTPAWLAEYIKALVTTGVYADELAVTPGEGMAVTLAAGRAWLEGYMYHNDASLTLPIENADKSLGRKDSVVIRLDLTARTIQAKVLKGTFNTNPEAPEPTRTADVWDLKVAEIDIPAGAVSIDQTKIKDTRLDDTVCGVTVCTVQHIPTGTFLAKMTAEFYTWFTALKDILNQDEAVKLISEITKTGYVPRTGDDHLTGCFTVGNSDPFTPGFLVKHINGFQAGLTPLGVAFYGGGELIGTLSFANGSAIVATNSNGSNLARLRAAPAENDGEVVVKSQLDEAVQTAIQSLLGNLPTVDETIRFTVSEPGGVATYKADKDMTFDAWADSEYNTGGYKKSFGKLALAVNLGFGSPKDYPLQVKTGGAVAASVSAGTDDAVTQEWTDVKTTDVISPSATYRVTISTAGGLIPGG